jgi:hypothetical protein
MTKHGPVLADLWSGFIARGRPVYSVTSEIPASVSFQTAPPKAARSDPSPGTDGFGALVDSSTPPDTGDDHAPSAAQQPSASQRRADDAAATSDSTRPRDIASASQPTRNASDDRNASAQQASGADPAAKADATTAKADQRPGAKSGASKPGDVKSTEKPSSGSSAAADSSAVAAAAAPQAAASVTIPSAVVVANPVIIASTDVPAAPPASGNATAPLAIAAAAIAASSPAPAAPAASTAEIKINSEVAAATAATAATAASATTVVTANTAAATATAKVAVQAAASAAIATPVKQPATPANAAAAADPALTAAVPVAATESVAPKTTLTKAPLAAPPKAAAAGASEPNSGTADPSATATPAEPAQSNLAQPPAVAARPEAGNVTADIVKADSSAGPSSTSATPGAAHDQPPAPVPGHTLIDSSDTGVQATGTIQPQLASVTAAAAPVGTLNVTAATNAPVPLSGLAVEIAVSARSGKSRFEIRLDPADLGRIDVRVDVDRNGQVTSHLRVEKPETLSMLRQDAPQLQRALDDAGLKTGNGGLQFSLRDQSSSGQNNGNETGRNAQRLVISNEDTIPAAVAERTYGRVLGSSSGVDIRV